MGTNQRERGKKMCRNTEKSDALTREKATLPRALVYGSLNLDNVYTVEHIVAPGETLASTGFRQGCGGKGLNQAIALAKAGAPTALAGRIGADGGMLRDACVRYGVDEAQVLTVDEPTGNTIIQVDRNGQNCILLFGGANQTQTKEQIDRILEQYQAGDYLFLQNEVNLLPYLIERAHARGMQIVLNPSPFEPGLLDAGLEKLSWLILNEVEGGQMTGAHEPQDILDRLRAQYPGVNVVLTLGEHGSVCVEDGTVYRQACCPVKTVDTTAAGDTFTGFFFAQRMAGQGAAQALAVASHAAAITVSRPGAADSIPGMEEVINAMKGEP